MLSTGRRALGVVGLGCGVSASALAARSHCTSSPPFYALTAKKIDGEELK
jgi:hypothetical protein